MSDQITPEQAQKLTEESWQERAKNGIQDNNDLHDWCRFAQKKPCWQGCPIDRIARRECYYTSRYKKWYNAYDVSSRRHAAYNMVDWLIEHRDELIRVGHEILAGGKQ